MNVWLCVWWKGWWYAVTLLLLLVALRRLMYSDGQVPNTTLLELYSQCKHTHTHTQTQMRGSNCDKCRYLVNWIDRAIYPQGWSQTGGNGKVAEERTQTTEVQRKETLRRNFLHSPSFRENAISLSTPIYNTAAIIDQVSYLPLSFQVKFSCDISSIKSTSRRSGWLRTEKTLFPKL